MDNTIRNIRKKEEFNIFTSLIEKGSISHWITIAEVLEVNKDTITEWKKRPEARKAIVKGISHAIKRMEETGKNDWRMWQAKLKMYGIDFENKKQLDDIATENIDSLVIYKPEKMKE